jgi:TetR/AcrR family transcriptional regulator
MRLRAQVRRQQIVSAATRLFARKGFDGTTTRQIASAAGVNEAIIFRHFPSKEQLYRWVVSEQIQQSAPLRRPTALPSSRSPKKALSHFAETLLKGGERDVVLTRLLLFSALRDGELSESLFRSYTAGSLELIAAYIREGVDRGRLRKIDPELSARAFVGMVLYHRLIQELFAGDRHLKADSRQLGRLLADIWLNGVSARPKKSRGPRVQRKRSAKFALSPAGNGFHVARKLGGASARQTNSAVTA